jgi:hypothetical protein
MSVACGGGVVAMVETRSRRERIVLDLHRGASPRQKRELGAFVRYCVERIERDLGPRERWAIRITMSSALGYSSSVAVHHLGFDLESTGTGSDGVLATWDAMGRVEQLLRDRRGAVHSYADRDSK